MNAFEARVYHIIHLLIIDENVLNGGSPGGVRHSLLELYKSIPCERIRRH